MKKLCALVAVAMLWSGVAWGAEAGADSAPSKPPPSLLMKIETQKGVERFISDYLKAIEQLPDEYLYIIIDAVYMVLFVSEMEKGRDIFINFDAMEALSSSMIIIYDKSKHDTDFSLLSLFQMALKMEKDNKELSSKYKTIYSPIIKRAILGEGVDNPAHERDLLDRVERTRSMSRDLGS